MTRGTGIPLAVVLCGLLSSACSPDSAPPAPRAPTVVFADERNPGKPEENASTVESRAKPNTPQSPPAYRNQRLNGIRIQGVAFDSRNHRLRVVDQPNGPGSTYPDASAVGRNSRALTVVNGGFFTPEGKPLGLVVSEGTSSGSWNTASSLGTGIWSEDSKGQSTIRRRSQQARSNAASKRNLLQAGPLLIENGKRVNGLSNRKTSARTMLLWDGGHRWWIGICSPTTLADLAHTVATNPPTPWNPKFALNLDGGRSSEIWVNKKLARNTIHHRPIWNRPVRNFLVLEER